MLAPVPAIDVPRIDVPRIDAVVVAVPARNEEGSIAECIASIDAAAARLRDRWPVDVHLVVAADSCTDRTVEVARAYAPRSMRVTVIAGGWRSAGAARFAAVDHALDTCPTPLDRVWIANTDADCAVPPDWLSAQLALSLHNVAVAGIVELHPASGTDELTALFSATYRLDGDRHEHVHGANLGVRADVYANVGGWCPHTEVGEDHGLWQRVKATGHRVVHATAVSVLTSARTASRVEGGFASGLGRLLAGPVTATVAGAGATTGGAR